MFGRLGTPAVTTQRIKVVYGGSDGDAWPIEMARGVDVDALIREARRDGILKVVDVTDGDEITFFMEHVYAVRKVSDVSRAKDDKEEADAA